MKNCASYIQGAVGFVMIVLFSTHRRVPVLKSTLGYVMMSPPWRRWLENVGFLALCRISEIASDNTSSILVPRQITGRARMTRVHLGRVSTHSIAGYTSRQYGRGVHQIGAIALNYYCTTVLCTLLRVQDARPRHHIRVELYSSIPTGRSTAVRAWYRECKM